MSDGRDPANIRPQHGVILQLSTRLSILGELQLVIDRDTGSHVSISGLSTIDHIEIDYCFLTIQRRYWRNLYSLSFV